MRLTSRQSARRLEIGSRRKGAEKGIVGRENAQRSTSTGSELRTVATKRRKQEKSLSTESGKIKESKCEKQGKPVYRPKTEKRRVEGKYI